MSKQRLALLIDTKRCIACNSCAVACKIENNLPDGNWWNRVMTVGGGHLDEPRGEYPNLEMYNVTLSCQHCENPPCLRVCPTGATKKRDDGIVYVDSSLCIGCRSCMMACPYDTVRSMNEGEPEYYLDVVVGEADAPIHEAGTVEKCTFCHNLIDRGEVPACMQLCMGRARYWGDLDDPESEVSKAIEGRNYYKLRESVGTGPNVFYLTK